ncbi:MAG: hypothetical protein ACRCS8_04060 [Brevinema sp.]
MTILILLTSTISIINLYFLLKQRRTKPFDQDVSAFKIETEKVMVEFNRITTRNISILDDKIEELDHKIRIAQKIDSTLKERLEEFDKINYLKDAPEEAEQKQKRQKKKTLLAEISEQIAKKEHSLVVDTEAVEDVFERSVSPKDQIVIVEEKVLEASVEDVIIASEPDPAKEDSADSVLFEGVPVQKIKKHQSTQKQHETLLQYLKEEKTREELLSLGFSNNEINLATMSLSLEQNL